jgi:hypothetical protein
MSVHIAIEDFRANCLLSLRRAMYLGIVASLAAGILLDPLEGASMALGVAAGCFARQLSINELAARAKFEVSAAVKSARRAQAMRWGIYVALFGVVMTVSIFGIPAAACGLVLPSVLLVLLRVVDL